MVYPRVGGGNWLTERLREDYYGLSPRGRGKPAQASVNAGRSRSIPAWAGETTTAMETTTAIKVYPRVGGGNGLRRQYATAVDGLSPRGRGKRPPAECGSRPPRSIPAWAGETAIPYDSLWANPVYPRVGGGNRYTL